MAKQRKKNKKKGNTTKKSNLKKKKKNQKPCVQNIPPLPYRHLFSPILPVWYSWGSKDRRLSGAHGIIDIPSLVVHAQLAEHESSAEKKKGRATVNNNKKKERERGFGRKMRERTNKAKIP